MSLPRNTANIAGKHAFLSPSTYRWLDKTEDELRTAFFNSQAAARGDKLHVLAKDLITLGVKLPPANLTLNMYVNDAIGFGMEPECPLYYTDDCFGTADALCLRDGILRIHDLKTGIKEAEMKQLLIYAGIFFLSFPFKPRDLTVILRIYQNDDIVEVIPTEDEILYVMDRIRTQARLIAYLREVEA